MDRLRVAKRHHTEDSGRGLAGASNLAPEANTPIGLLLTAERSSDGLSTSSRIYVRSLGAYLFLEVSRRLHAAASSDIIFQGPKRAVEAKDGPVHAPARRACEPRYRTSYLIWRLISNGFGSVGSWRQPPVGRG